MIKIQIKNMVCERCIMMVGQLAKQIGIGVESTGLGYLSLTNNPPKELMDKLETSLHEVGFEILSDNKMIIIEKIKNLLNNVIYQSDPQIRMYNISHLIEKEVKKNYNYLSNLFSEVEGSTIEKYYIKVRIERAKELISYHQMNFTEIASFLGYNSLAHFTSQFKNITGIKPSEYLKIVNHIETENLRIKVEEL